MLPTIVLSATLCFAWAMPAVLLPAQPTNSTDSIEQLRQLAESDDRTPEVRAVLYKELSKEMEKRGDYQAAYQYLHQSQRFETATLDNYFLLPVLVVASGIAILLFLLFQRLRRLENDESPATRLADSQPRTGSDFQHKISVHSRKQFATPTEELTGCIAHDFNNLLQVIQTANEVTLKSGGLKKHEREMVKISAKSVAAGACMVKKLLSYSQQQNLTPSLLSVDEYLEAHLPLVRERVPANLTFCILNQAGTAVMTVDPDCLTDALVSLVDNAVESMPETGVVQLECTLNSRDELPWTELQAAQLVNFAVMDQGQRMTEEQMARAFEPFFSTKSHGAGSGLGLSAVHGFARQSEGDIRITSNSPTGTKVELVLPNALEDIAESNPDRPSRPYRILLVEDKHEVGTLLLARIRSLGFEAEIASSGEAAIQILENDSSDVDVVVSDIQMPGTYDGIQLRFWVSENRPSVPVVLMTGYNGYSSSELGTTVLRKPFSEAELLEAIDFERKQMVANRQCARSYAGQGASSAGFIASGESKN